MAFNDTYVESIQTKHVSNVGFTSTAKGVTNEAFALKNPHQVLSSQIPFIDVVGTYGPLVASGIAAEVAEEHIVKLTADPTVNNNKAWIAYETNCTISGHSGRGAIRVDKWMRYAETQYKLRLYEDTGSNAPDYTKEILPSEVNFNWEYDASAGIVYFDVDPDITKTIPLWGVFYTYIGGTVEEAIVTAANSIPDVSYLSFDCNYVDDYNWTYNSSGALTEVPGSLSVFVNGVKQRDDDPDYYTATIVGGVINLEFGFKVKNDDWVNIEYLTSEGGGTGSGGGSSLPDSGTTANVLLVGDGNHGYDVSTAALNLLSDTTLNGPASTIVAGPVELATDAETITGTDFERAVTPAGLAAKLLVAGGSKTAINQSSHGFNIGDVLYLDGGTYKKAIATDIITAEVVGIVSDVTDAANFIILSGGRLEGLSGLTAGTIYFLSATVSGSLTSTEPVTDGYVSKPILIADASDSGYFFNMRGVAVGGSSLDDMFGWNSGTQEITFKGHLIPETNDTFNIGSPDKEIAELYVSATTVHIGDNVTFSGTSLAITGDPGAISLASTPTLQASSLVLRPFVYNPGGGAVTSNPKLEFINSSGLQYGISFNTASNEFSFDAPAGVSEGIIKVKKITAGTIETTGVEQIIFDQNFRTDGNVILGYDELNTVTIKGVVDLRTPITFSQTATLGDGNDTINVNSGAANNFTVISKNINVNSGGLLTTSGISLSGDIAIAGNALLKGQAMTTQVYVDTISGSLNTKIDGKEPTFSKNNAFNKTFGTGSTDVCSGDDGRLSNARTPVSHDNTYHSAAYITTAGVTYETLNSNGDVGSTASTLCAGNDGRLSDARTPTSHDHNDLYYTENEINTISGSLDTKISTKFDIAGGNITGSLTIAGDLSVQGNNFIVNTQTVTAEDNLIVINSAETGAGVTAGVAGIEVERGSSINYLFYFDEGQDNFRVGVSGSLQAVATREDTPTANGVATWNNSLYRFDTTAQGTAFNKSFGTGSSDVCVGNDSRLSDARTPVSHNNTYHSETYITSAGVTYETLSSNGDIGSTASTLCAGNDARLSDARTPTSHAANASTYGYGDTTNAGHLRVGTGLSATTGTVAVDFGSTSSTACVGNDTRLSDARVPVSHSNTYHSETYITSASVTYETLSSNGDVGSTASTICAGNDSRLSDARTPVSHNNDYHSATYIVAANVTYETLNANSDVGAAADQVAKGDHSHAAYFPVAGGQLSGNLSVAGTTKTDGYFYAGSTAPTNATRLNYDGYLYATRVYNAVYNDIADFQLLADVLTPGLCYFEHRDGAKICTERCQIGVMGIASDTYGYGIGVRAEETSTVPIAVAGWVLAHVDKEYASGTPLTNNAIGSLTEMTMEEKTQYPERIIAIYARREDSLTWGPEDQKITVNGRHWVKVK